MKTKLKEKHLNELLDFSLKIVKKSENITLKYFNKKIKHKVKKNKTPVTIADFKCEDYLIDKIFSKYPEHSILSEERGESNRESDFKWIIDPIDGTKNFMRQYPFWGTLLALEYQGRVLLGVISMPALEETIHAVYSKGCYLENKKLKVSKISKINKSNILYGGLDYILKDNYVDGFSELIKNSYYSRGFGDCHGHSLIIKGQAEAMIDPHVAPYDIAAIKVCIEEAGGILTDLQGNDSIYNGNALCSNRKLHDKVLNLLNSKEYSEQNPNLSIIKS